MADIPIANDMDNIDNDWISLQIAAGNGHGKCVQMLIDHGVNVDAKDIYNCTALHLAAENGNHQCVRALLEAGADCHVPIVHYPGSRHVEGSTALHLAAKNNHVKCVEELLNFCAYCNDVDRYGRTSLYIAAQYGFTQCVLAHLKFRCGPDILSLPCFHTSDTPLHLAIKNEMFECIKELVRLGSDVNHINNIGRSPFHVACLSGWKNDVIKIIPPECYIPVTPVLDNTNHVNLTPSRYVQRNSESKMEILKYFVLEEYKTDIDISTARSRTPLYDTVFDFYNPQIATFLIAYGADTNMKDERSDLTLLEYELSIETESNILKSVVNCMSLLPHLISLNLKYSVLNVKDSVHTAGYAIWHTSDLPDNVEFRLLRDNTNIYVEMRERRVLLCEPEYLEYGRYIISESVSPSTRYRLEQPLLNLVYERVVDELEQLDCILGGNMDMDRHVVEDIKTYLQSNSIYILDYIYQDTVNMTKYLGRQDIMIYKHKLMKLKKCLWYERMASNPRTLQHFCRICIRKCMGPSNLKHIRKLPLSENLLSYLLFDCDEEK